MLFDAALVGVKNRALLSMPTGVSVLAKRRDETSLASPFLSVVLTDFFCSSSPLKGWAAASASWPSAACVPQIVAAGAFGAALICTGERVKPCRLEGREKKCLDKNC